MQTSTLGLAGQTAKLETMIIADTATYENFVDLPGDDIYRLRLSSRRLGSDHLTSVDYGYDHRSD